MSFFNLPKWPYTDFHRLNLDWVIETFHAVQGKIDAIAGLTATAESLPTSTEATVTVSGGTGANDPYALKFGLPRGLTGASVEVDRTVSEYAVSDSGVVIPLTGWRGDIPVVPQGQYLWTRLTITFRDTSGTRTDQIYTVARQGIDGEGSVKSVNNVSPDPTGNVPFPAVLYSAQTPTARERYTAGENINTVAFSLVNIYVSGDGDDDNPGTETAPLRTIGEAVRRIPLQNHAGIPTIHVLDGVYSEFYVTATEPIKIRISGDVTSTAALFVTGGYVELNLLEGSTFSVPNCAIQSGGSLYVSGKGTLRLTNSSQPAFLVISGGRCVNIAEEITMTINSTQLASCWMGSTFSAYNMARTTGTCTTLITLVNSIALLNVIPSGVTYTNVSNILGGGRLFAGATTYPEV